MKALGTTTSTRKRFGVGLALAGLAIGGALAVRANDSAAERALPHVQIRGESVHVDGFSLSTLYSRATLRALDEVRSEIFDECMAAIGFIDSPTADPDDGPDPYTLAFEGAAYGQDAWEIGPPVVELPDGTRTTDGLVWQPGSCAYAQDADLGTDPHLREALRYRIMVMSAEADQRTVDDARFKPLFENWASCSGSSDAYAFLEALEPADSATGDVRQGRRPGSVERECVDGELAREAANLRGRQHMFLADDNEAIVAAWIDLIDRQLIEAELLRE